MHQYVKILILSLLIPIASASLVINNNSQLTENTTIPVTINGGITYTFTVDGNNYTFNSDNVFVINETNGYHNLTVNSSEGIVYSTLIYDLYPPIISISNLTSSSYHYSQLTTPTISVSDPDNLSTFILSQTPIKSSPGLHIFSVTASDEAGRQTISNISYTVITNTTPTVTKDKTLLTPLSNSTISVITQNPVNLSLTIPIGFTTSNLSYTNITSLNFTIRSGIGPLDTFVPVSVSYIDQYGDSGTIQLQYWLVGNKTVFYITYDSDKNSKISKQEAINATKNYFVSNINTNYIKELIVVFKNNQSYIGNI